LIGPSKLEAARGTSPIAAFSLSEAFRGASGGSYIRAMMSMTDFIPATKKRQSARRPHSLTVPKEIRFGDLPPELAKHPEEGLWIVSSLFSRSLYDSRYENADQWVPLSSKVMAKIVRKECVKKWLSFLEPEFIKCRGKSYQAGVKSKEYRMSDKFRHQSGKTIQVRDKMVSEKLDGWQAEREEWKGDKTLEMLLKHLDKITIRRQAATDYIYHEKDYSDPSIKNPEHARNCDETSIEAMASKHRFFIVDKYRRIHTNLTNISSDLRQFLRLRKGGDLSVVDIRNSQPFIFGCLLHELLGMSDDIRDMATAEIARRVYEYANDAIAEDENERRRDVNKRKRSEHLTPSSSAAASSAPVPPLHPTPLCVGFLAQNDHFEIRKSEQELELRQFNSVCPLPDTKGASKYKVTTYENTSRSILSISSESVVAAIRLATWHKSEIQRYSDLCSQGLLYEFFAQHLATGSELKDPLNRRRLKESFFQETIYCKSVTAPDRQLRDVFKNEFPGVWKIACQLKSSHHSVLPKLMQFLESGYIRKAVEIFAQKHQNRFVATIHDSLMVEHSLAEDAEEAIRDAFSGIPLMVHTERLSWHAG
jgi:hypothetical protein